MAKFETPWAVEYLADMEKIKAIEEVESVHVLIPGVPESIDLPHWIHPLQFEKNLSLAVQALQSVEALLAERRALLISQAQLSSASNLSNSKGKTEIGQVLHKMLSELDFKGYIENIELRLYHKLYELREYARASFFGATIFLNTDSKDFAIDSIFKDVNNIRSSIRAILERYQRISMEEESTIIPISCKYTLQSSDKGVGNYCTDWNEKQTPDDPEGERNYNDVLQTETLTLNLSNVLELGDQKLGGHKRIIGIGAQIIDKESEKIYTKDAETYIPDYWNLTLKPKSGFNVGKGLKEVEMLPVEFLGVKGSKERLDASWSSYDGFINFNPNREWTLKVGDRSQQGQKIDKIRDIIIYFEVIYRI